MWYLFALVLGIIAGCMVTNLFFPKIVEKEKVVEKEVCPKEIADNYDLFKSISSDITEIKNTDLCGKFTINLFKLVSKYKEGTAACITVAPNSKKGK